MDQSAPAPDSRAPADERTTIPTSRQVAVRTAPAAAVAVIGIPMIVWLLVNATGEMTTWWLLVLIFALLGLSALVLHFVQAPRPRFDKRISTREVIRTLSYARRSGTLPTDPRVRTAAGVFACGDVETLVMIAACLIGGALAVLIRPEFAWVEAGLFPAVIALIFTFKARLGCPYLKVLHSASQAG
ncbi:hypothetical protein [Kocuria marina]|uniref:hypothetical protein n=1 Tax=Kocuria marina TaxID=223184 RepID=UPI00345F50BA